MNSNQLEVFCLIARVKSFSKAARLLHLSQPAVSAQIRSLEEHLGAELFERQPQGVEMTAAGRVVYRYATQILALWDSMEKHLDNLCGLHNEELAVAASSCLGNYALPCAIYDFGQKHPAARVRLEIANRQHVIGKLQDNQVQVGIIEGPLEELDGDFKTKQVAGDILVIIAAPKPPWADRQTISLEDLRSEPLILRENGSGVRRTFEQVVAGYGLSLDSFNVTAELGSMDAVKSAVQAGLGLGLSTRLAIKSELHRHSLHAIELAEGPVTVTHYLVYRAGCYQSAVTRKFVQFITSPGQQAFC